MVVQEIIDQLNEVYEGSPWYGNSISTFLDKLKPEGLSYRINDGHSIGQIIQHMITWRKYVIDALNGKETSLEVGGSIDWSPQKTWNLDNLKADFNQSQKELIKILSTKDEDFLSQKIHSRNYSFEQILTGIIQHDIYHLGQIYLLNSSLKNP